MAKYSNEEIASIFKKLAASAPNDVKFKKFERFGVLMAEDKPAETEENRCITCRKVLPSAHLLDLHVSENHDSFFAVKVENKKEPMVSQKNCRQKPFCSFFLLLVRLLSQRMFCQVLHTQRAEGSLHYES